MAAVASESKGMMSNDGTLGSLLRIEMMFYSPVSSAPAMFSASGSSTVVILERFDSSTATARCLLCKAVNKEHQGAQDKGPTLRPAPFPISSLSTNGRIHPSTTDRGEPASTVSVTHSVLPRHAHCPSAGGFYHKNWMNGGGGNEGEGEGEGDGWAVEASELGACRRRLAAGVAASASACNPQSISTPFHSLYDVFNRLHPFYVFAAPAEAELKVRPHLMSSLFSSLGVAGRRRGVAVKH